VYTDDGVKPTQIYVFCEVAHSFSGIIFNIENWSTVLCFPYILANIYEHVIFFLMNFIS